MAEQPLIIEAAINGGTPKHRNPNVPRSVDEIVACALACIEAGASIVHNHNDEPVLGGPGRHASEPYAEAWRRVLRRYPEVLLYPTMAGGGPHTTIEERYRHVEELAEQSLLPMGLVDPGSVNMGRLDRDGVPAASSWVYQNTYADTRHMIDHCLKCGVGASISIFEPGFLRLALAYYEAGRLPKGSIVKLYFGAGKPGFGLPPTRPSLDAYLAMLEGTGLPWLVASLEGDVTEGLAQLAIERGGHVRVGLEDYAGPRQPKNEELVAEVVALAEAAGRPIASPSEARRILASA